MYQDTLLILLLSVTSSFGIHSQIFNLKIKENIPENSLISDLSSYDYHSPDLSKDKQFTLILEKKANTLFKLTNDGKLLVAKPIDRERLCSQIDECCHVKKLCNLSILVAVSSPTMYSPKTFECQIQIDDENDNAPTFKESNLTIFIKESEPVGSLFRLPMAQDLDSERFSVKNYKLVEDLSTPLMFSLEQSRAGTAQNLQLIQRLDREKRASYELTLLAIDGGSPPLSGKLLISIKVVDVNDNAPRLLRNNYKISIPEDQFLTNSILAIEATDDDELENADLHFRIVDENRFQNDANKYFRVEQSTGKIYLNEKLDYEKQENYRFYVEVFNKNGNIETATATVLINVENKNDEIPEISISYLNGGQSSAVIEENNPRARFVALATVTDKDKGIDGQVSCKLLNYFDTFEILTKDLSQFQNQYDIKTKVSLDREKRASYKITMECEDKGYPVQKTRKDIHVIVEDKNDNSPKIITDTRLTVKENLPRGSLVSKIEAKDDDNGRNGEVTFSIDSPDEKTARFLEIDSVTGELRTKEKIDREYDVEFLKELKVPIKVSDNGVPRLSEIKTLTVTIIDENDNPPQFQSKNIEMSVPENQATHFMVGEIFVTDKDEGSKMRLTLQRNSSHQIDPFIIVSKDNKFFLNTTRTLDWEKEKSFPLIVIATDGSNLKSHSVTGTIHVTVIDENDNDPIIIFPSQRNFTIPRLSWLVKRGVPVLRVTASDKDGSENGRLIFDLMNHKDLFFIDPNSGEIRTDRLMNRQDVGRYDVNVVVRDQGSPAREARVNVAIEIDDSRIEEGAHYNVEGHQDNGRYSNNVLWIKESFLVISLVVLLFFLMACIFLILYMRHTRGLFPALPDIFLSCRRISKNRKCSRSNSYGKSLSDIPFDSNPLKSPLSFQQINRNIQEKVGPPFYLNQYESSGNSVTFPIDHHLSVNPYRQYESLKYQHYPGPNSGPNIIPYSYDKLFYSPSISEDTLQLSSPQKSDNHYFNGRHQIIPDPINSIPSCRRIINNIERSSPLIQDCDEAEKQPPVTTETMGSADWRGHSRPSEKIDTYAITFPHEQSTFV